MDEGNKGNFPLPQYTTRLNHQIAGHIHGEGTTKLGLLKHDNGSVLKPLLEDDKRGKKEYQFYETVFDTSCEDPEILTLRAFLPAYKGIWYGEINGTRIKYLCMNDVTEAFHKASILDVKVGRQTYDPEAKPEKIKYEKVKYPAVETIGFRILGMRVYDSASQEFIFCGKDFGKKQTSKTLTSAFHLYLNNSRDIVAQTILSRFLHRLYAIEQWFRKQRKFSFFSSSLLFIYEGETSERDKWKQEVQQCSPSLVQECCGSSSTGISYSCITPPISHLQSVYDVTVDSLETTNSELCPICYLESKICSQYNSTCSKTPLCNIHMVDFAHVFSTNQQDDNYLFGLTRLIGFLQTLQRHLQKL